jgi:hypothetical protein
MRDGSGSRLIRMTEVMVTAGDPCQLPACRFQQSYHGSAVRVY